MKKNLFIALLILINTISFAQIQWQDDGVPVRQGENIEWNQSSVACEDGTFISIWSDTRNGTRGIYAQKVDDEGNLLWGEDGLEIYQSECSQFDPIAVSSNDNSVIISWLDGVENVYDPYIHLQKIDENGNLLWGDCGTLIESYVMNNCPQQLVSHNDGGVYVFWNESWDSNTKGMRFSQYGSIVSGWENGIEYSEADYRFKVSSDHTGGILLSSVVGDDDVYIQRIDESGNMLWGNNGTLLYNGENDIRNIEICTAISGEYFFSLNTNVTYQEYQIMTYKVNYNGSMFWDEPNIINGNNITIFHTTCPIDSQPIVSWIYGEESLCAQKIDETGNSMWGSDGVLIFESENYLFKYSVVSQDYSNGCVLTWLDVVTYNEENIIYAQKLNGNGEFQFGANGLELFETSHHIFYPSVVKTDTRYYFCTAIFQDGIRSLKHQITDVFGNILLEENGEEIYSGLKGKARNLKLLKNGDNPIMLWCDRRYGNAEGRIFLQVLDSDGSIMLEENGIPFTIQTDNWQYNFDAVFGENSETIAAVWNEDREEGNILFTQGVDTSGNQLWSDSTGVVLNPSGIYTEHQMISVKDNNGIDEFYYSWEAYTDFFIPTILAQKIVAGEKQWSENGVEVIANDDYSVHLVDVIERFYIWTEFYWPENYLKIKLLDENGNTALGWQYEGLEISENPVYINNYRCSRIDGGILLTWFDGLEQDDFIKGQIVTDEGDILWEDGGIQLVEGENVDDFNVIYNGNLYVCWNEQRIQNQYNYYLQKYDENGQRMWQEGGIQISYFNYGHNDDPKLCFVENDILIVWQHRYEDEFFHIEAQLVSPEGDLQFEITGLDICNSYMDQGAPKVYVNETDAYICWLDDRSTENILEGIGTVTGIYAQKLHLEPTFANENIISVRETQLLNYPNPFNPETTISFQLNTENTENTEYTEINIFNIKGQKIKQLEIRNLKLGINDVIWDGKNNNNQPVASGIYFYQLNIDDKVIASKKCLLLK